MKSISCLLFLYCLLVLPAYAQIGIGGQPHPSAVLDLKSPANDKAFYPPRLTTAQRKAIANPQAGAFVYDIDKGTFYISDGQNWLPLVPTTPNNIAPIDRTASDGTANDYFGNRVAILGDYAIVGAFVDDIGANTDQGSAYVFVRSGGTWIQQAKLTASDGEANEYFGWSVAISGDYAIVGAPYDQIEANFAQGSAYVFVRSGSNWTQQAKLTASNGAAGARFGGSVAISGDYAIVGACGDAVGVNSNPGSAYVLQRTGSNWTFQSKLTSGVASDGDNFGWSVAISGDYAIVGADLGDNLGYNGLNINQGYALIFVRNGSTWTFQRALVTNDGVAGDNFGISVAISGDYAIVGAHQDAIGANRVQGSAYVFVRSGNSWTQQAKLIASDGADSDYFGWSVAISGDYAIVGANASYSADNSDQGSAYVFRRTGSSWTQVRQVTDNSPASTYNAINVGISNGSFIIGKPGFESGKGKVSFGTVEN
jgi:FG-GAP repeat